MVNILPCSLNAQPIASKGLQTLELPTSVSKHVVKKNKMNNTK